MNNSVETYKTMIVDALQGAGAYSASLEPLILTAASALRTLDLANQDIDELVSTVIDTPQGKKGHPVFRIRKEAEDSVLRQLKALGLIAESLSADIEADPLVELTKKVANVGKHTPATVKPKK